MQQCTRLCPQTTVPMAVQMALLHIRVIKMYGSIRPGDQPEHVLKERLVAWDRKRAAFGETVLFLGLCKEALEDGVVQVRCAHHEPPVPVSNAECHVARRNVGRSCSARGETRLPPPPHQHLSESHNVADLATFAHSGVCHWRSTETLGRSVQAAMTVCERRERFDSVGILGEDDQSSQNIYNIKFNELPLLSEIITTMSYTFVFRNPNMIE